MSGRGASVDPQQPGEELLLALREDLVRRPGEVDVPRVARISREHGQVIGAAGLLRLTAALRDHVQGLGALQDLAVEGVTDILVNGDGEVWVEDPAGLRRTGRHLSPESARALAVRLASAGGRRLDDACPWVDAHLPDGTRLHAVLPPLSDGGTLISLRRPSRHRLDLDAMVRSGGLDPRLLAVLHGIISSRLAFLISGGTGTGKTTLLGAMLSAVPASERIVVVEDARELDPDHPHVVHLQARHANTEGTGGVDLAVLVRQCLRMRPDRIVVGECRGAEIRELLQALNTGHEGGCGTVHANAAADVPARLEALGALGGLDRTALASQAVSALDVVIHLGRREGRRTVDQVARLVRDHDGSLRSVPALDLVPVGPVPTGLAGPPADDGAAGRIAAPRLMPGPAWPELAARIGVPLALAPDTSAAVPARTGGHRR